MPLPVGLSYNAHPERWVSLESLTNMQPEVSFGGRQQVILRSCPGLSEFSAGNTGATEGRGCVVSGGVLWAVIGSYLYQISSNGTATQHDYIAGSGPVGMSTDGDNIHIAIGTAEFAFNITTEVLTTVTKTAYGYTTAYHNGRFITEDADATSQGRIYYSDVADPTTWSDVDFATAEQKTDNARAVFAHKGVLLVFGSDSVGFWGSDATGPIPVVGAYLNVGLAGRRAVAAADEIVGFLASDGAFRIISGYNSERVSTPAVEAALDADSAAEVCAYVEQGHTVFEVSTTSLTLCYDLTESQRIGRPVWFKKESATSRHKARFYVRCYDKVLCLSATDGRVYELTRDTYPDVREFTVPTIANDDNRAWGVLNEVELIQRVGTAAPADETSYVMARVSRNNGLTWGDEKWADEGQQGNATARVRYRRLGRFRNMSMKFRKTDQTEWTVLGVFVRGS